jgi:subtilisin family serine protease
LEGYVNRSTTHPCDLRRFVLCCLVAFAAQALAGLPAYGQSKADPIDFRFRYLRRAHETSEQPSRSFPSTIRFRSRPTEELLESLEAIGVKFVYEKGSRLGTATVYPAELNLAHLAVLATIGEIVSVEPEWRPFHTPPLDVSRPQIQADSVWKMNDARSRSITGKGILIADLDTGVDFFHPMLFFADGDTLNWIDVNTNGTFDPGVDAVDLNKNGIADAGELLRYIELAYSGNNASLYDVDVDFLYNDANNNGVRDKGTGAGFTEATPTYGEQWFVTLDANHDNRLSPGEKLAGLKTSKIRAIRELNGTTRRRGVDLILANPDTGPYGGHGTSVAGIAIGGIAGIHKVAGIAPGAEMVFASLAYNSSPPFVTTFPVLIAWMQAEGAHIMLYEDGEWVWDYLDGSSNVETMIDELASTGIVQVTPAGNLTGGAMQMTLTLGALDSVDAVFTGGVSSTVWPSIRWRGEAGDLVIRLQVDAGSMTTLPADGSTISLGGKAVYSDKSVSSRGTAMLIVSIAPSSSSTYTLRLVNTTASDVRVDGMLGDDGFSWSGLARWSAATDNNTVTWPATADSGLVVAAYRNKSTSTDINSFSGRGTRIDGRSLVDVAAPGSTVYTIGRNVIYTAFGGTSSAGPHVAGAAALLLQADTTLGHAGVENLLRAGAATDAYTGAVPNATWGYGKLRVANAIAPVLTSVHEPPMLPSAMELKQNYPNPFNPTTTIEYTIGGVVAPGGAHLNGNSPERRRAVEGRSALEVKLAVYDILGREVAVLVSGAQPPGTYTVELNASRLASGAYFYCLSVGTTVEFRKMVFMK